MYLKYFKLLIALILSYTFTFSEINIYTHRHYDSDKVLFKKFTDKTGIEVNVIKGSADQLIQRLVSEGKGFSSLYFDIGRCRQVSKSKTTRFVTGWVFF